MQSNFRNRYKELERLEAAYRRTRDEPIAVIVRGPTGCGKSSLVSRFLDQLNDCQTLHVRDVDQPANSRTPFKFIHNITQSLDRRHKDGFGFSSFFNHLKKEEPHLLQGLTDAALADFGRLLRAEGLSKEVSNRLFSQSNISETRILRSELPETVDTKIEYIRNCLSTATTAISIENVHSMDYSSLEQIPRILPTSKNNIYIFEYTESSIYGWGTDTFDRVTELIGIKRIHIPVGRMRIDDVLDILGLDEERYRETIQTAYVNCDGNLRHLANLEFELLESGTDVNFDRQELSANSIKMLPKNQQIIFVLIHIFGESLPERYIQALADELERTGLIINLESILTHLGRRRLVERKNGHIISPFGRTSFDIYDDNELDRLFFLSVKYWIHFYETAGSDPDSIISGHSEKVARLTYFYSLVEHYENIISNLDNLRQLLLKTQTPGYFRDVLSDLFTHCIKHIANTAHRNAILKICLIYYEVGLYSDTVDMISRIRLDTSSLSHEFRLVYWASRYMLEENDEVLRGVEAELNELSFNDYPRYYLSLKVLQLTVLRSSNDLERHKRLHEKLSSDLEISQLPEYGYVLRHSEIAKPLSSSIRDLRQSIEHFERANLVKIAAISCLNLGMQLALSGKLAEAEATLDHGEKTIGLSAAHRHKFLNNRAAIVLYQPTSQSLTSARRWLEVALRLAVVPFDRIVILNNLLLVGIEMGGAESILGEAQELREFLETHNGLDRHLHQVTYYNISRAFSEAGRTQEARQFLDLSKRNDIFDDELWRKRYTGNPIESEDYKFLAEKDIVPCFLADWHYYPGESLYQWGDASEYSSLKN